MKVNWEGGIGGVKGGGSYRKFYRMWHYLKKMMRSMVLVIL